MAKTYSASELRSAMLGSRIGDDCFLLAYPPKRKMNDVSKLIWDLKENRPQAIAKIMSLLLPAFKEWEPQLRDADECPYIISIPGHAKGKVNEGCEAIAAGLAARFDWLKHLPKALRRTRTVAKASTAASVQERPGYSDHMESISYFGPAVAPAESIIMMDDVLTRSDTSRACRDILMRDSKSRHVVGLFMGKTS
jgi:hypothetical protein